MKKTFFCAVLLACTSLLFGQMTDTEIANAIKKSKEANEKNGIFDPHTIKPGDKLTFLFEDGSQQEIIAAPGDSQWKILKTKVSELVQVHGPVVPYVPDEQKDAVGTTPPITADASGAGIFTTLLWWVLSFCVIAYAIFSLWKRWKENRKAKRDPVTSGPPMREGGVQDSNAYTHAQQVAERQFNSPGIQVTNIVRGRMSGKNVAIFYAGKAAPERKTFSNIVGYRGTIRRRNGEEEFIYFLQGCGNDARTGNYFTGAEIQFIPEQEIQNPNQSNQSVTEEERNDNSELVALTNAVAPIAQALTNKHWGKIHIEADGKKIEMNFGTADKAEKPAATEKPRDEVK